MKLVVKITKESFEKYLNKKGGDNRKSYGSWLRREDPQQFNVLYNEYVRGKRGSLVQ